jgi:lupus La protein
LCSPSSTNPSKVEFYFGDHNLPTDKFLWELTDGTGNKPVPLKTICKFKRMQRFQPYEDVVAALKESSFLDLIEEKGEDLVKRKVAYSPLDRARKEKRERSIVKGFGEETPSTQFDLEAFFVQFGDVVAVRLRRTEDKSFKGSVFVEFQDEEQAKSFIDLRPAPKWKDQDLKIMSKTDYAAEKVEMIKRGEMQPNTARGPKFYEGRGGSEKQYRGPKFDKNDWKKRREHDQKNGFRDRREDNGRGRGRGRGRGGGGSSRGGHDRRDDREGNHRNEESKRQSDNEYVECLLTMLFLIANNVTASGHTLTLPPN